MKNIKAAEKLNNVGEYYFSQKNAEIAKLRAEGQDIVSLGIDSPDLPPHRIVIERLYTEAQKPDVHVYQPYRGAKILRNAIAEWYKKYYNVELNPEGEVLPLLGSKEGIMHIYQTFLNPGDKVLIPNPGYPTYKSAAYLTGAIPVDFKLLEEENWMPDFDGLEKMDLEGVKVMIVNYPNMPTGARASIEIFERLVDFAKRHNILLVHDNPYSFTRTSEHLSLLSVEGAREIAIEMNSLSKSHNMAGWRVGMVCGAKEIQDKIMIFKSNMDSGMFYPVQAAAAAALTELGDEWYDELNEKYFRRAKLIEQLFDTIGCKYAPGQEGLFVWAKIPDTAKDSYEFSDKYLYGCGVFLVPGAIFGSQGERYVRACLCAPEEHLQKAIDKIKASF